MSLLIVLVILYLREPSDFTGFPTLLLFITLFRLALNVASTRLILLDGFAGHIIEAFGNFVVREKRSRVGRNPQTGQEIEISARRVLTFRPSQVLKNALNSSNGA